MEGLKGKKGRAGIKAFLLPFFLLFPSPLTPLPSSLSFPFSFLFTQDLPRDLLESKQLGFSDKQIACCVNSTELAI